MSMHNRVFPLTITTLSPLHIDSGTRLAREVDFYDDEHTTYIINSDVALELALRRWEAAQLSPEEQRRQEQAALDAEEERLRRRRERNIREITAFEDAPPKDRVKRLQQEERLVGEASRIKADLAALKRRREQLAATAIGGAPSLPDELIASTGLSDLLKMGWLTPADLQGHTELDGRPLVRYAYAGRPKSGAEQAEILAQIKDVADRPYLPGSSLKGALRSALAWEYAQDVAEERFLSLARRGAKQADNEIEADLFYGKDGSGPRQVGNHVLRDVLRALHVADSGPSSAGLELLDARVFPKGSPLAVEAIPAGAQLSATLQVERYALEHPEARRVLDFGDWARRLAPEALAASCRRRAQALIAGEQAFFQDQAPEPARFYADLAERLAGLDPRSFLLPVGWGAGWRSKTLDERLRESRQREREFAQVVRQFRLKKQRSDQFRPDDLFPATRKLAFNGGRPWRPLGWLQVTIGAEVTR